MPTTPGIALGAPAPATPQAASQLAFQAAQAGFYQAARSTFGLQVSGPAPPADAVPMIRDWYDTAPGASPLITGINQLAAEQGQPKAQSWWMRRMLPGPGTVPQSVPMWLHSRPYSRGAGAHAPKFGTLPINPIGGGVYAPYRLPTIAGPGARYEFGAIWFDVQTIPTSIRINPTIPIETINALIATSRVAGTYITTG